MSLAGYVARSAVLYTADSLARRRGGTFFGPARQKAHIERILPPSVQAKRRAVVAARRTITGIVAVPEVLPGIRIVQLRAHIVIAAVSTAAAQGNGESVMAGA